MKMQVLMMVFSLVAILLLNVGQLGVQAAQQYASGKYFGASPNTDSSIKIRDCLLMAPPNFGPF